MKLETTTRPEINHCVEKNVINKQQPHWERVFENSCSRFGDEPSYPARKAAVVFEKKEKIKSSNWEAAREEILVFLPVKAFMYIRLITPKAD
jgi:hypothetical protein